MKIMINAIQGSFGYSREALEEYARRKNITLYSYENEYYKDDEWILSTNENNFLYHTTVKITNNDEYEKYCFDERHIERTDQIMIAVVEDLKEKANSQYAKIKIIEIPEDIEYTIKEDDSGYEWVAEKHRIWK